MSVAMRFFKRRCCCGNHLLPAAATSAGSYAEAIRGFESIRSKKETELAAICAIMYFLLTSGDRDAAAAYRADLETAKERATPPAMILAATFFWHINDIAEARRYVDRVLSADGANKVAQSLRGWIDLCTPPTGRGKDTFEKSVQWFEGVLGDQEAGCVLHACARACAAALCCTTVCVTAPLSLRSCTSVRVCEWCSKKDLSALMGRAKYYDIKGDYEKALESLNTVTVLYAWFLPAVIEKARVAIKSGDWDQGIELAKKVLDQDSYDIESLRILVLEVRCRCGLWCCSSAFFSHCL